MDKELGEPASASGPSETCSGRSPPEHSPWPPTWVPAHSDGCLNICFQMRRRAASESPALHKAPCLREPLQLPWEQRPGRVWPGHSVKGAVPHMLRAPRGAGRWGQGTLLATEANCSLWHACYSAVPCIMSRQLERLVSVNLGSTANCFLLSRGANDVNTWPPRLEK